MDSLITQVIAWPTLLASLLVFGFAPGAVLRMIVLAFRRDDPRRTELLAELPHVPRIERPFWVSEQLEVALFEGLAGRVIELVSRKRHQPSWQAPADVKGRTKGTKGAQQDVAGKQLGTTIRIYRTGAGLTQHELAGRSGLSVAFVRDLEQGRRRRPRMASLAALADTLGLDPGQLTASRASRPGPA
jgi:DNA-binding transcriptional regulator YiaG